VNDKTTSTHEISLNEIRNTPNGNGILRPEGSKVGKDLLSRDIRRLVDESFGVGVELSEIDGLKELRRDGVHLAHTG